MDDLGRLRQCTAFLLDMDGTIYVDEKPVPGAVDFVHALQQRKIPHLFLTNNSAARAEDYRARLATLGIYAPAGQVMTSGDATIQFLLAETDHRSAYVVGTPALEADFRAAGIDLDAHDPDCVVVGFDRTLTFAKLQRACRLLFDGKPYYATHPDKTCITRDGLIPDIAAIIGACQAVTGRVPKVIGKPNPEIVELALKKLGAPPERTAMIGDQLDTDMAMAQQAGLVPVLVLSGETTSSTLAKWPRPPTLVAKNVSEVGGWLGL